MHGKDKNIELLFTYSYRLKNKQGSYASILQRFSYILSHDHQPIGAIGYVTDLTGFNSDCKMIHLIQKIDRSKAVPAKELLYQKYYFPEIQHSIISKREIEILKWISSGLSSKQIADKLKISANTVNNHRKKMLQKTNSSNTAELLVYALSQKFL